MLSQRTLSRGIGAGALAFGVLGLARPAILARWIDSDEELARELGFRDLGNALVFLGSPDPRPALAQRLLYDVSDALMFGRRKPGVAVAALGGAALSTLAFFSD